MNKNIKNININIIIIKVGAILNQSTETARMPRLSLSVLADALIPNPRDNSKFNILNDKINKSIKSIIDTLTSAYPKFRITETINITNWKSLIECIYTICNIPIPTDNTLDLSRIKYQLSYIQLLSILTIEYDIIESPESIPEKKYSVKLHDTDLANTLNKLPALIYYFKNIDTNQYIITSINTYILNPSKKHTRTILNSTDVSNLIYLLSVKNFAYHYNDFPNLTYNDLDLYLNNINIDNIDTKLSSLDRDLMNRIKKDQNKQNSNLPISSPSDNSKKLNDVTSTNESLGNENTNRETNSPLSPSIFRPTKNPSTNKQNITDSKNESLGNILENTNIETNSILSPRNSTSPKENTDSTPESNIPEITETKPPLSHIELQENLIRQENNSFEPIEYKSHNQIYSIYLYDFTQPPEYICCYHCTGN